MAKTLTADNGALAQSNLRNVLAAFQNTADAVLTSAGLAIKTGGSALAKSANTITCFINGTLVSKAASDMAAFSGSNVATGSKNIYVFCIDASGTLTTLAGTAATTLAGVLMPTIVANTAVIGFAIVDNATGSNFVPGTTALDTASLTVTYVNTVGDFTPGVISL